MVWIVLLISAVLEAVWATALGESEGLTKLVPVIVFFVGIVLSMLGLGYAAKHIPISTAYAIWTGTGAALTVSYAIITGEEAASTARLLFLVGIVVAVVGLKIIGGTKSAGAGPDGPAAESANSRS